MNGDKEVLSTTPSIDDYNAFVIQTNEYEAGLIKEVSTSQALLVYNKTHTKASHRQPKYLILKQQMKDLNQQKPNTILNKIAES
jgi:hypothetical protein